MLQYLHWSNDYSNTLTSSFFVKMTSAILSSSPSPPVAMVSMSIVVKFPASRREDSGAHNAQTLVPRSSSCNRSRITTDLFNGWGPLKSFQAVELGWVHGRGKFSEHGTNWTNKLVVAELLAARNNSENSQNRNSEPMFIKAIQNHTIGDMSHSVPVFLLKSKPSHYIWRVLACIQL